MGEFFLFIALDTRILPYIHINTIHMFLNTYPTRALYGTFHPEISKLSKLLYRATTYFASLSIDIRLYLSRRSLFVILNFFFAFSNGFSFQSFYNTFNTL